ncbi:MAG: multidrug transporter AcrB [Oceanospirillaceae bacterium]|uniref:efflux RND transporter permease subunit n=1 Tax=unclassified Thalassolituus TaxID=2624967 RepID=UPI000C64C423|nr:MULTISPECIES: efflux RND transporter permease subunit [unclassified Thalassolituus]MAS25735.1 multidrug transporter AcrB [Oceanospirillaceae bacterium]MBS54410.1 multidrug transporter AcrB [Oceanospirillaceae bacterium]
MSLGISGKIAHAFQNSAITPLLALVGLLLGFFAIMVTPKEEEPQIDVTFANVYIGFPGASAREVEQLVSIPAEQVLSEIKGVDDIFSISQPGQSVLTVAFEVGIPREEAILNLYNQVHSNKDWFPQNLGVSDPIIKPMGIDDVPIMAITLSAENPEITTESLTQVAHALEVELKRIPGTRDIYTIGGHNDVVQVRLDPARMNGHGLAFDDVRNALMSANAGGYRQPLIQDNEVIQIQAGNFLQNTAELQQLIVGKSAGGLVYLSDVATISRMADVPDQAVFTRDLGEATSSPAVTLAIAKQPGMNAIDITQAIDERLEKLHNRLIPAGVKAEVTRDYGITAKDKSDKLIAKLLFATAAVVVLVLATMSWREAIIVGGAIFITLAITLFASWVWGFTLNRVSLFALIFSIGILVDDAIVVVENIHRHLHMGGKKLLEVIPVAVDEVGGPTILATFTVIAALMPMAFVSGLMGPYMSPIPINASTGMLISLAVAFVVTPWLSYKLLNKTVSAGAHSHEEPDPRQGKLYNFFNKLMRPFTVGAHAAKKRVLLFAAITGLIFLAVALPAFELVVMKMLPFDNKSEFQVMVDMPEGTPVEQTLRVMEELSDELMKVPEIKDVQLYAGTASPINFNGLVRQYYMRAYPNQGDIQVNLVDKHERDRQSHDIALSVREPLQKIGLAMNANVKIVEVPPGPPVMAPIVAEVYGPDYDRQIKAAKELRSLFENTADIVDVDDYVEADQEKWLLDIDRQRAAMLGVAQSSIVQAINTALGGEDVSYLHTEHNKYPLPIRLELAEGDKVDLNQLMVMKVRSQTGAFVPLADLVHVRKSTIEKNIYHKNLQPVVFVTADMAGELDSPLYGLFSIAFGMEDAGLNWEQWYIQQPALADDISMKWDGEWQITYETFRDMGIAYGVGMILIYLLVVGQFRSYLVPLIIMAPIPLTVIGVMPGHALFGAQFTATSMIGMIALAGIIVRNSILLVDFINQKSAEGMAFADAVIVAAAVRARPIVLTAVAAMIGAFFILDDPIFNGLAISLIFGIFVSTMLTLVIIPLLYYAAFHKQHD